MYHLKRVGIVFLLAVMAIGTTFTTGIMNKAYAASTWTDISADGFAQNMINGPYILDVDPNGNLYVVSPGAGLLSKLSNGNWSDMIAGTVDVETNLEPNFNSPQSVAYGLDKKLYVPDMGYGIRVLDLTSGVWTKIDGPQEAAYVMSIAVDKNGVVYVTASDLASKHGVFKCENNAWTNLTGSESFSQPYGIDIDAQGTIYVSDPGAGKVKRLSNGTWTDISGTSLVQPTGISVDLQGNVFLADPGSQKVLRYVNGEWKDMTGEAGLVFPIGVSVGNDGVVYLGDSSTNKIMKLNPYVVTFNSNGGTPVASLPLYSGDLATEPVAPTRAGYSFEGWFADEQLSTPWDFATGTIEANTTLHAKWEALSVSNATVLRVKKDTPIYQFKNGKLVVTGEAKVGNEFTSFTALPSYYIVGGSAGETHVIAKNNKVKYSTPSKQAIKSAAQGKKVLWNGMVMKKNEIGRLTVTSNTALEGLKGSKLTALRTLAKGGTYRVYGSIPALYHVGNGNYVVIDQRVEVVTK